MQENKITGDTANQYTRRTRCSLSENSATLSWPNIVIIISGSVLVLILSIVCNDIVFSAELPTGWQFTAVVGRSRFVGQASADGGGVLVFYLSIYLAI